MRSSSTACYRRLINVAHRQCRSRRDSWSHDGRASDGASSKQIKYRFPVSNDVPSGTMTVEASRGDNGQFITVEDFARIAKLSRRTIDRYRRDRPTNFPREYDVSRGRVPRPRFKLADVLAWMETRALW